MKRLTIFYDPHCGICSNVRRWMMRQPAWVALEFVPYDSREAMERLPELAGLDAGEEIVVMGDDGSVWQGPGAWVVCLWALCEWRPWAERLASPVLMPLAAKVCRTVSANRMAMSRIAGMGSDAALAAQIAALQEPETCGREACTAAPEEGRTP